MRTMSENPYDSPKHGGERREMTNLARRFFYLPFMIGLAAYAAALFNMSSVVGEILSDVGNGVMLSTAVLLLIHLNCRQES